MDGPIVPKLPSGSARKLAGASAKAGSVSEPAGHTPKLARVGSRLSAAQPASSDPKGEAKQAAKDVLGAAAKGAVGGAGGGFAGAGVGAAKGAATAILKNKTTRRWLITGIAVLLAIQIAIPVGTIFLTVYAVTSITDSNNNGSYQAVLDSGVTREEMNEVEATAHSSEIPWQIILAVKRRMGTVDSEKLYQAITTADSGAQFRDLGAGTVYDTGKSERRAGDTPEQTEAAASTRTMYTGALAAYGIPESNVSGIYDQALRWYLGQALACAAPSAVTGVPSPGGGGEAAIPLTAEMQSNVITIIGVAKSMFPSDQQERAALIAIATAMQESGLKSIDYGDEAGPDSRGLFQQRTSWGSLAVRMDPAGSSRLFFQRLIAVPSWSTMELGDAAYAVQIFQHDLKHHYTEKEGWATQLVSATFASTPAVPVPAEVGGVIPAVSTLVAAPAGCAVPVSGDWTSPILLGTAGVAFSDFFGPRNIPGTRPFHFGIDLAGPAGTPVLAAAGGAVVVAAPVGTLGNSVSLVHSDGATTQYSHLLDGSLLVNVGDVVAAGQPIGAVGSTGLSGGNHLDFRTFTATPSDRTAQDPVAFMLARGVDFRSFPILSVIATTPTF